MDERDQRDWRELCVAVANETDSMKLGSLVQELITALDEGEQNWRPRITPAANRNAASWIQFRTADAGFRGAAWRPIFEEVWMERTLSTKDLIAKLDHNESIKVVETLASGTLPWSPISGALNIPPYSAWKHQRTCAAVIAQRIVTYCANSHWHASEYAARELAAMGGGEGCTEDHCESEGAFFAFCACLCFRKYERPLVSSAPRSADSVAIWLGSAAI